MSGRVLIAVTHLLGSGHLVRMRHLARALTAAGFEVTLASGGVPLPARGEAGFATMQLPPVQVAGVDFRNLLDEAGLPITPERRAARGTALTGLAQGLRPDIVVTEHFPFGRRQLADEFLGLIAAAKAANPAVLVLSSVRDVLVAPKPERIVEAETRLGTLFDAVLVHGDDRFLPLDASWPVSPSIAGLLRYTGYLAADGPVQGTDHNGEIVVSGGGSMAALPLFEAALGAAALRGAGQRWRVLCGRGFDEAVLQGLRARAASHVTVERARPDFATLLSGCALSVSQAGYNTVLDLVQAGCRALVVPFDEANETEQSIRADALARAGLARSLPMAGLAAERLARAVNDALAAPHPPRAAISLDGAARTPRLIEKLLRGRSDRPV